MHKSDSKPDGQLGEKAPINSGKLARREDLVLKMVVEEYLNSSEPVSSRFVANNMNLSSATIRNIMSDLEGMSYISAPHISAGRLPTDEGFRYYVDNFINLESDETVRDSIRPVLESLLNLEDKSANNLLKSATKRLSELTNSTCFVAAPKLQDMELDSIKFMQLQGNSVLAVIVTKAGYIHNTIFNVDQRISKDLLDKVADFLNENFVDRSILDIRNDLENEIEGSKKVLNELANALQSIRQGLSSTDVYDGDDDTVIISGRENIFSQPEFNDPEKLSAFFTSLAQRYITKHIIDQCIHGDGAQIFIGSEVAEGFSGSEGLASFLDEYGVIVKSYGKNGRNLGFLGVVGPKRMDYAGIVPILNCAADLITEAMERDESSNRDT